MSTHDLFSFAANLSRAQGESLTRAIAARDLDNGENLNAEREAKDADAKSIAC
jgi:hypothetical protein